MARGRRDAGLRGLRHLLAAAVLAATIAMPAFSASADPVDDLVGRWSGWGSVTLAGGQREQIRCVAVYEVAPAAGDPTARTLTQSLKCASASYKVDASASLRVVGGSIEGDWVERQSQLAGRVIGKVSPHGIRVEIDGTGLRATLAIAGSACRQTVALNPEGGGLVSVAMSLAKC
jgi:hypothetical protein